MCHLCRSCDVTQKRRTKWSVRKRGTWGVYPPGQCCPAVTFWDHGPAVRRAQELAKESSRGR